MLKMITITSQYCHKLPETKLPIVRQTSVNGILYSLLSSYFNEERVSLAKYCTTMSRC